MHLSEDCQTAGFLRRMAAIIYDAFLLFSTLFVAASPAVAIHGRAISHSGLFSLYLLVVAFVFFGWFWTHGGQTLGMRAWKLRLVDGDLRTPNWKQAMLRFLGALLSWAPIGLGYLWIIVDDQHMAWHDRLSGTRICRD